MLLHFFDADFRLSVSKYQKRILKTGYVSKRFIRNNPYKRTGKIILFRDQGKYQITISNPFRRNFCAQNKNSALWYKNPQILPAPFPGNNQPINHAAVYAAATEKMIIQPMTADNNFTNIFSVKSHWIIPFQKIASCQSLRGRRILYSHCPVHTG